MNYFKNKFTTINSQLNLKNQNKLHKQVEENHRYGDHLEGYQLGGQRRMREKVQGIRSINGRYKIDGGKLKIL